MFEFEKLDVYKKAKIFNSDIRQFIKTSKLDRTTNDQLRRASLVLSWTLPKAPRLGINFEEPLLVLFWIWRKGQVAIGRWQALWRRPRWMMKSKKRTETSRHSDPRGICYSQVFPTRTPFWLCLNQSWIPSITKEHHVPIVYQNRKRSFPEKP